MAAVLDDVGKSKMSKKSDEDVFEDGQDIEDESIVTKKRRKRRKKKAQTNSKFIYIFFFYVYFFIPCAMFS